MVLLFDDGKRLEKAVGEEAAQVIVSLFERMDEKQRLETVSKGDLRETELRLLKEIKDGQLLLEGKIKEMEIRLLKWQLVFGLALALIMAKGFGWLGF